MALSEHERQVMLFTLGIEMVPSEASKRVSVAEAFSRLNSIYRDGKANLFLGDAAEDEDGEDMPPEHPTNALLVRDFTLRNDGTAVLLFQHGDTGAPDPALMNMLSQRIRTAGKTEHDGLAHACHLVVEADDPSPTGHCKGLLERVPNLGRTKILFFLNKLLRIHSQENNETYLDTDGKRKRCHPKLVAHSQLSHNLKNDIRNGKLSRIEFISNHVEDGFEENNVIVPVSRSVTFKVMRPPHRDRAFDFLKRVRNWGRSKNYEEMRVHFKSSDDNKNFSPRFATDVSDAHDLVYSRMEPLSGFREELEQCPEQIVEELVSKMLPLLEASHLWK